MYNIIVEGICVEIQGNFGSHSTTMLLSEHAG